MAVPLVQARIAAAEHRTDDALAALRQAVAAEDRLAYNEPPDWFVPSRQVLGALLLQAGKPADAEKIYREDLQRNAANGWSLHGLAAALKAQGKDCCRGAGHEAVHDRVAAGGCHADGVGLLRRPPALLTAPRPTARSIGGHSCETPS